MSEPEDTLAEAVRDLATPVDWRAVSALDAEQRWSELADWVHWLIDRYVLDHRVVPPCWYLHGALVDLLAALRDHHREHLDRYATPSGTAEWQLMFRNLEPRLREWASRTGCSRDEHRPDVTTLWPDDHDRWDAHLATDLQDRVARGL